MKTTKYLYGLSALLLSAALGSCAYESEKAESPTFEKGTFTLNVTTGSVGAATTRTVTSISSDAALTDTKADAEKTVSSLVWGIYHAAEDANQDKKVLSKTWTTPTSGQTAFTVNNQSFGAEELKFEGGDHVLVAANLSATELAAYADFSTKTAFQQNKLGISEALTGGTGTLDPSKLPMFGTSTVTADTETEFSSNVTVNHLVAKVTLNSLSVDFTGTGHASATFKPLEVFLINVPDELTMQYDGTTYAPTGLALTKLYQGEADTWSGNAKRTFADYLGTGAVYEQTLAGTDTYSKRYSLYTMPYDFAATTVTYASDNTRLVIKGEYRPSGGTAAVEPMYYAVNLNNGTGDYKIKPNTHYKVTATIKGPGADNAYDAIPLYQNFTANVHYEEWTEEATTATVDNGGTISWSNTQRDPVVGDLYFDDGSWGTAEEMPTKTPIGIVFKVGTTTADQALGYKNGYVMALKKANEDVALASGWGTDKTITATQPGFDLDKVKTDYDGLSHCRDYKTANGGSYDGLYAMKAADEYTPAAPTPAGAYTNSGWYLPSIGQQYLWLIEFTKGDGVADNAKVTEATVWNPSSSTYWTAASTDSKKVCKTINDYVKAKLSTDANKALYQGFNEAGGDYLWSSSWRIAGYPFYLNFHTTSDLFLGGNSAASSATGGRMRAVLAF